MVRYVTIDLETFSAADLPACGAYNFAAHPSTMIRCLSFKEPEGKLHKFSILKPTKNVDALSIFKEVMEGKVKLVAHNYLFEMRMLNHCLSKFLEHMGYPHDDQYLFEARHFVCTMTMSRMARGPAALVTAAQFFKNEIKKDSAGKTLMTHTYKIFGSSDRHSMKPGTKLGHILEWKSVSHGYIKYNKEVEDIVLEYCATDVEATHELFYKLANRIQRESGDFWDELKTGMEVTCAMNERGIGVDVARLEQIQEICGKLEQEQAQLINEIGLDKFSSPIRLQEYFAAQRYEIESFNDSGIRKALIANPGRIKEHEWLARYNYLNKTSLKKAAKALSLQQYGRMYDTLNFCGASETGRWSSHGMQVQNLPRPDESLTLADIDEFFKGDLNNYNTAQSSLRTVLIPDPGEVFMTADLRQVEARQAFYATGHLEAMKLMAEGYDLYKKQAATTFGVQLENVTKEQRQMGKMIILAGQYGMGAAAYVDRTFVHANLEVSTTVANKVVQAYRRTYNNIPREWHKLTALINKHDRSKPFMFKLATGRYLNYGMLEIKDFRRRRQLCYKAVTQRGIMWKGLWGGQLFQHKIQAECRDILMIKMNAMHRLGYKLIFTVHDEVIISIPNSLKSQAKKDWENAGKDKINVFFPGLLIDSDVQYLDRYWK